MAYYVIPNKKDFEKSQKKNGMKGTFDEVYKDFVCDVCGKKLVEGDRYFLVRTDEQVKSDGKPAFRHIMCDEDFLKS